MSTSCWYHAHWAILTEVGCVFVSQRAPPPSQSCASLLRPGPHLSLRKSLSHFSCLIGSTLEPKCITGIHFTPRKSNLFFFLTFFFYRDIIDPKKTKQTAHHMSSIAAVYTFYILIDTFNKWKYVHLYKYSGVSSYLQKPWWLLRKFSWYHFSAVSWEFSEHTSPWRSVRCFLSGRDNV